MYRLITLVSELAKARPDTGSIFVCICHPTHRISVLLSHAVSRGFVPRSGHIKNHHKNGTNCLPAWHAML